MTLQTAFKSPFSTLSIAEDSYAVDIIDQTRLPHEYRTLRLRTLDDAVLAISSMQVRGAPLIGVTAAFGVVFALLEDTSDEHLTYVIKTLAATRPTAVNLNWALSRMQARLKATPEALRIETAWQEARHIAEEDAKQCAKIGEFGLELLRPIAEKRGKLNIMTHCNAGSLATIDYGTALAPIYIARQKGIDIHVWVSETRPRNQGLLTAWELKQHGIPHTILADNAAGWLMMDKQVDAVIVGADRIAINGDVANKVGTYLKALAAKAADIPFYVAAPHSTIDFSCPNGASIPIEERNAEEVRLVSGIDEKGHIGAIRQISETESVINPAFDVTPAQYISAIVTERGYCKASNEGIKAMFPNGHQS